MGYSDQKFYSRELNVQAFALSFGTSTGVGTASNTATGAESGVLPVANRKTKVNAIRLRCTTIPNASSTALVAQFQNAGTTFGTVVLTTATASGGGQPLVGVITAVANSTLAAGVAPTVNITGTATVSGAAYGSYDIFFETQEMP